ncbi:MAG TPA: heme exporter protein CcmD [Casimicrobiaceae bacterium]|nr:heme exporter protein CcmD [Casimicrobiaceae bacterium]
MNTFFAMNGYGFYIWSAYGVAVLAIVVEILLLRSHRKAALAQARSTPAEPAPDSVAAIE